MRLATKVTGSTLRPSRLRFARAAGIVSPVTFPATPLDVRTEIALGADPAADPATWSWLDITPWVRYDPGVQIVYGRRDESSRVEASSCRLTLDNRGGRWVRRNPLGPYYRLLSKNTPIRVGVNPGDGVHYRYHGFVNEWPTRWTDEAATDSTVTVGCGGVLRRLQQARALKSALYRSISGVAPGDYIPTAYWPMEDGQYSTQFAEVMGGGHVSVGSGVTPAGDSTMAGSEPVPTLAASATQVIPLPGYTATDRWFVEFVIKIPSRPASLTTYASVYVANSPVGRLDFAIDGSSSPYPWRLRSFDTSGSLLGEISLLTPDVDAIPGSAVYGGWALVVMGIRPSSTPGNYIAWGHVGAPGYPDIGGGGPGGPGTAGFPAQLTLSGTSSGVSVGHVAMFTDPTFDALSDSDVNTAAIAGWAGEQAHARMIRLCREEGLDFACTSATSALMGAQSRGTLLDALRECEASDMGVLYEHEFGLGYQSLDDRLNAQVQLALDFDQRHVAGTPEPADDDQRLINSYTAGRSGGSSATISDPDSISAEGVFAGSGTFSLYTDDQTLDVGGWRVHLGIVDEDRWPSIPIRLHATPDLIPSWAALPYGVRMTLANPPAEVAPDVIDAIIEGWTETIRTTDWSATLNTSPASPYQVGKLAADTGDNDPFLGWLESDTCTLTTAEDAAGLSWQITSEPVWTENSDDFPVNVRISGEVVTVGACSATVLDTFSRSTSGSGTADTGQVYTDSGGTVPGDYATNGSQLLQTLSSVNVMRTSLLTVERALRLEAVVSVSAVATGASITARLLIGYDGNSYYAVRADFGTSSTVSLALERRVNGSGANLTSSSVVGSYGAGTQFNVVLDLTATGSVNGKLWAAGTAEPPNWPAFAADSSLDPARFTMLGLACRAETGNTNVSPIVAWDSLELLVPQTWTISARARNGVTKSLAAGEAIELVDPIILVP